MDRVNMMEAARLYNLSATQGNKIAQYNLGNMFEEGRGVKKDMALAQRWWAAAAQQGDKDAQAALIASMSMK